MYLNLKRKLWRIFCVIFCVGLVAIGGCKESTEQLVPIGALIQADGCKESQSGTSSHREDYQPAGPYDDCIEYHYNGTDTLFLRHINASFNCCPGEITAEIVINGSLITITERQSEEACDCICLFDLDYEITNLARGEYTLRVEGLYLSSHEPFLEYVLQLHSATSGTFCLPRNIHPWNAY